MCQARTCHRWPLRVFYHILNTVAINAKIIDYANNPTTKMLVQPQIMTTSQINSISKPLKRILNHEQTTNEHISLKKSRRSVCPRVKDIQCKTCCRKFNKNMCLKQMNTVCNTCYQNTYVLVGSRLRYYRIRKKGF